MKQPNRASDQHLDLLVRAWGLMADVGFCDLLLLQRASHGPGLWQVTAQVRPTTHQTLYAEDLVGVAVDVSQRPALGESWDGRSWADSNVYAIGSTSAARSRAVPVPVVARGGSQPAAVVLCEAAVDAGRRRGRLERAYVEIFDQLAEMVSSGRFPYAEVYEPTENLRVGDGVIVLDSDARIRFASPNATSSLHRLGVRANAEGKRLTELGLHADWLDAVAGAQVPLSGDLYAAQPGHGAGRGLFSPQGITTGGAAVFTAQARVAAGPDASSPRVRPSAVVEPLSSAVVATYLLPLNEGSVLLMRDVTDVRRRDRLIRSKDATIREVHHRVKNNLQTISSLLRLQGRRTGSLEAREAIEESVRRIRSMALVHETLSQGITASVPFNEVIKPLVRVVEEGLQESGYGARPVRFVVEGSAGELPAEIATPLSIVLVELLQNAVEHGYPGTATNSPDRDQVRGHASHSHGGLVRMRFDRTTGAEPQLRVVVRDDGRGFPPGFSLSSASAGAGLGLTIVRTLITSELGGVISTYNDDRPGTTGDGGGAVVEIRIPVAES